MVDFHVHSDYSQDAEGTVFDYCREAAARGLEEICFTPHLEIDPRRTALDDRVRLQGRWVGMRSDWIDAYAAEVRQANAEFAPLKVRLGIEVGYDPTLEDELAGILKRHRFDYVLGSIHCIDHVAITAHDPEDFYYARVAPEQATAGYFGLLDRAVRSRLFDAIGHIDVFKKYGAQVHGSRLVELAEPYWPGVFQTIVEHSPLTIEVNTSGLRQGPAETYPAEAVLATAVRSGLKYVTIGSDAHRLPHLGFGLEPGIALVERLGLRIAAFEQRQMRLLPARGKA
jgi:histidinol-phosphatase (PHP family)